MALPSFINIYRGVFTNANLSGATPTPNVNVQYKAGNTVRVGTGDDARYFMCVVEDDTENTGMGASEVPTTRDTTEWVEIAGGGGNPPISGEVVSLTANPNTIDTGTGTQDVTLTFSINSPYAMTEVTGLTANNTAVTFAAPARVNARSFSVVATVPISADATIQIAGNIGATLNGDTQAPVAAHTTVTIRPAPPAPAVWYAGARSDPPTALTQLPNQGNYSSGVTATIGTNPGATGYILLPTVTGREYNFLYQGGSARIEVLDATTAIGDHTLYTISQDDYDGSGSIEIEVTHG